MVCAVVLQAPETFQYYRLTESLTPTGTPGSYWFELANLIDRVKPADTIGYEGPVGTHHHEVKFWGIAGCLPQALIGGAGEV